MIMLQCCTEICDQSDSVTCLSSLSLTASVYRSPISTSKRKKKSMLSQNYEIKSKFGRFSPGETTLNFRLIMTFYFTISI